VQTPADLFLVFTSRTVDTGIFVAGAYRHGGTQTKPQGGCGGGLTTEINKAHEVRAASLTRPGTAANKTSNSLPERRF